MSKYAPDNEYTVDRATDPISIILDAIGMKWTPTKKHLVKDDSVRFDIDDKCEVDLYKQRYYNGYGMDVNCVLNGITTKTTTSFIDSIKVDVKDSVFKLYVISSKAALNAGIADIRAPVEYTGRDVDIGISCDEHGKCKVSEYFTRD